MPGPLFADDVCRVLFPADGITIPAEEDETDDSWTTVHLTDLCVRES